MHIDSLVLLLYFTGIFFEIINFQASYRIVQLFSSFSPLSTTFIYKNLLRTWVGRGSMGEPSKWWLELESDGKMEHEMENWIHAYISSLSLAFNSFFIISLRKYSLRSPKKKRRTLATPRLNFSRPS